jgi:predicted nucleic acid-binding protein
VKVYLDSSVVLRVALGEPNRLKAWSRITTAISSELVRVECLRVLDRMRIGGAMDDRELARRRATMLELLDGFDMVRVNRAVLDRASEPFPTLVRTLDALHIASALLVRSRYPSLRFATHDDELAIAALAEGLPVIGTS